MDNIKCIPLSSLPLGKKGIIKKFSLDPEIKLRLLYLGLTPNTIIEAMYRSPFGAPTAYLVRGTVYALRHEESNNIWVEVR